MYGTPIEQLQLSVRATNVLHRMEINTVEELVKTPIVNIASQRNIGVKTLDEIKLAIAGYSIVVKHSTKDSFIENKIASEYTNEQLLEMSSHSIDSLEISVRAKHALQAMNINFLNELVLTPFEYFAQQRNVGVKTLNEIKEIIENIDFFVQSHKKKNLLKTRASDTFTTEQIDQMSHFTIRELKISVRAKHALQAMNINFLNELVMKPLECFKQQRNIGVKTIEEIKGIIDKADVYIESHKNKISFENLTRYGFTAEQLDEMSNHTISELNLSARPYNALFRYGYQTINKVAQMTDDDFNQMEWIGKTSVDEIKASVALWINNNIILDDDSILDNKNEILVEILKEISLILKPFINANWKQLFCYINPEVSFASVQDGIKDVLEIILCQPQIKTKIKSFFKSISFRGVITETEIARLDNQFYVSESFSMMELLLENNILMKFDNVFLVYRDSFLDAYKNLNEPNVKYYKILYMKSKGNTLQNIGDVYGITRERVRQICSKLVSKLPLLFEDYFSEPYQYFYLSKQDFLSAFPEVSREGFEFLSIRYEHGKKILTNETLNEYNGLWKFKLFEYLRCKDERDYKDSVSKSELVLRVLIENSDRSLSISEFIEVYYQYIEKKDYPIQRLKINNVNLRNFLINIKGVVFDQKNKVRYCDADPNEIWTKVDFTRYRDMIISTELIFHDYKELMDELGIRDGYELFYVIKSSIQMWNFKIFPIRCRRVPVMILGDGSEYAQAIRLLRENSPILYSNFYELYEKRYGLRKESAKANPAIANAVSDYYADGMYIIDIPSIDENDLMSVRMALKEKPLWFFDDIEMMFDNVCKHTSRDAINSPAFRQVGYTLNTSYAYDASYGTALNLFDKLVFSKDIIELGKLDRRMINLGVFNAILDKKKNSLEYIEVAPKVLMSKSKVNEVYGITQDEIKKIQSITSHYYDLHFFNGHSIWQEVKQYPVIKKLKGNDWMLTCIMRQQENVFSFSLSGGIILSNDSSSLNISSICEWIASIYGSMPINKLVKKFNEIFGVEIHKSKLAAKLKISGVWNKVVTDSIDKYIDSLIDASMACANIDDLLKEEFL